MVKTYTKIIIALVVLQPWPLPAHAGSVGIGNGGGLSESNFEFARLSLPYLIDGCLKNNAGCGLSAEAMILTSEIHDALPTELAVHNQLAYRPTGIDGFFSRDGEVQVIATEPAVGSKIYVNLDLIYPLDDKGHKSAVSTAFATKHLVMALATHIGAGESSSLRELASTLETLVGRNSSVLQYGNSGRDWLEPLDRPTLTNTLLNAWQSLLMFADSEKAIDLTSIVISRLKCPGSSNQPLSFRAQNEHWSHIDSFSTPRILELKMQTYLQCQAGTLIRGPMVELHFEFDWRYIFNEAKIIIR